MVKKASKGKASKAKEDIRNQILGIFSNNTLQTFNYKQIARRLYVTDPSSRKLITVVLNELEHDGHLMEVQRGKYKLKSKGGYICGTVQMTRAGAAYIITDDVEEDVFVSSRNLKHAFSGDKVKVYLYARRKGDKLAGEVTEILEQRERSFVGTIGRSFGYTFLYPDNKGMANDILINPDALMGAKPGQKAIVKIVDWPEGAKNPIGEVIDVLGDAGDNNTEMHAIMAEFELPYKFPKGIEDEAAKIPGEITKDEIKLRRDMRKVPTLTIDPADAKDFDDALSIERLDNGNWEVGIHIADVSHYVRPYSKLDQDAFHRGTSVYLVDRVVPMLPERLSNGLCSLRPNEDKLCFSAVFEMKDNAEVVSEWFGKTVIHSDKRFDYAEAQSIIEGTPGVMNDEVLNLFKLSEILREKRFRKGAFSFDRAEVKFKLDEEGAPTGIYFKEAKESNWLVEEFMLLANKKVAEFIGRVPKGKTAKSFVYRIHDRPNPEKLENFSNFIHRFGHSIKTNNDQAIASSMNALVKKIKGKNEQYILETLAIRTMAKAKYSCKNIGHYGLAFQHYTHFTSPIRRYPDLMVHRLLEMYLAGEKSYSSGKCEAKCEHSSNREELAVNAERASIKYKQVQFLQDKIGKVYEGIISGVSEWGFFVELSENHCEGMVPMRELDDDFYEYDEGNYCITGTRTRKTYTFGQKVKVEILQANLAKRQLDFGMAR